MYSGGRIIRQQYLRLATATPRSRIALAHQQRLRPARTCCSAQPHYPSSHLRRAAIDPVTFLIAAALSTSIAYLASGYLNRTTTSQLSPDDSGSKNEKEVNELAPSAHTEPAMAPQTLPGRPGNLTPDQETKLKEMWHATLEVFGVSHDETPNGTVTPSSASDAGDLKKKKKSRLSMFGKKGKGEKAGDASEGDNDKHGQTKEFQQALASQTPEQLRDAFWSMAKHDHPDALLLRFLRARKWDVQAALVMLVATMHWRSTEMHVDDDIMIHGEAYAADQAQHASSAADKKEGADFMAQLRMGKSFLHGQDKDGRPCCYVRVKLHRQGEQSEKSLERYTVYTIETARMLLRAPVDTATIVFDMTDFSMANMDYTPVKFMIKCFEANYPESLGSVLVYKSPFIFRGIWNIIKGWLDPVVASKVHFASNVDDLSQWIPKSQIMKELGGAEAYTYQYIEPRSGENDQMQDTAAREKIQEERTELVKSYEAETMSWIQGDDGGEGRGRLAQRLAENYWRLDPYVRAKTLYDRQGVLGQGGKLDFYPKSAPSTNSVDVDDGVD